MERGEIFFSYYFRTISYFQLRGRLSLIINVLEMSVVYGGRFEFVVLIRDNR